MCPGAGELITPRLGTTGCWEYWGDQGSPKMSKIYSLTNIVFKEKQGPVTTMSNDTVCVWCVQPSRTHTEIWKNMEHS